MTREEITREIHRVLVSMSDYQWKSAQEKLKSLYSRLNESPADITCNYRGGWYESRGL
jgi:hypothetical protein